MKCDYFASYRKNVIGCKNKFGSDNIIYADWCGSGRLYEPIEREILNKYAPFYSNLHSSGNSFTDYIEQEYYDSKMVIKRHFGANEDYFLCVNGQGMTSALNQCIEIIKNKVAMPSETVVFLSPYEHNSNFLPWVEKGYQIEVLELDDNGEIEFDYYVKLLEQFNGKRIIVSITACSNVTGILIDVKKIAQIAKKYNALVFVDFTACAPYISIDMNKSDIDVLVCSMHKFVGGVQGVGILLMHKSLYKCSIPSRVGGGTVRWVNPFGRILYWDEEERREEAGTVPILQTIRSKLAIELKESIGVNKIKEREMEIAQNFLHILSNMEKVKLFTPNIINRLPIFSIIIQDRKFVDVVRELNDTYGIQVRGGCCCASLCAHKFLKISPIQSKNIYDMLYRNRGREKQMGWTRISLNYLISDEELEKIKKSIESI